MKFGLDKAIKVLRKAGAKKIISFAPVKHTGWHLMGTTKMGNKKNSSVTYWLNQLQNLKIDKNIFLTINPFREIPEHKIFKKVKFTHPYYDNAALSNQNNLNKIQNKKNILFCGSYFGYGFHEDGIKSSIDMLKTLND